VGEAEGDSLFDFLLFLLYGILPFFVAILGVVVGAAVAVVGTATIFPCTEAGKATAAAKMMKRRMFMFRAFFHRPAKKKNRTESNVR
jgi:hypothetical protein